MDRGLDIRITAASERGFVVHEAGEIVAALSTASEVASWLEDRLRNVQPEPQAEVLTMPRHLRSERAGWFKRGE